MRRKALLTTVVLVCVLALTVSCATKPPPTPRHSFASYLANWNDFMESYRIHYVAQTPEVQVRWTNDINPTLLKVNSALNIWGENPSSYDKEQAFLLLKREAEMLIFNHTGLVNEEVVK